MAGVKALCVRGIRSFGPDDGDQQYIAFNRPLTLILGQNGCGKTTIIECLRYAVTGQHPPGARNECFVYDAKVNKTRDVLGQVKLKIVNSVGHEITVTRSMQVTSKQKKQQFKTLDGAMERVDERGKKVEITSRCADLDLVMQEELGVSKAIINSVIFCHQEDACWPLEEGKKVKDRFDEIFDSDRYSDCFDRLTKIRKDYAVQIKLLDLDVRHLSEKKGELDKRKLNVVDMEKRISGAELRLLALERDMKPVLERLKAIERIQNDLIRFESEREKVKVRLENCMSQQRDLKKAIQNIFQGSDEELKQTIDNYDLGLKSKQRELKECCSAVDRLIGDEQRVARDISSNDIKFNELMLLEGQHLERIDQRNTLITNTAAAAEVRVGDELERAGEAARALAALAQRGRARRLALDELRARAEAEERTLQGLVDQCRDAVSRHKQKMVTKAGEMEKARSDAKELEREIAAAHESRAKLDALQLRLNAVEKEFATVTSELDSDKAQTEINDVDRVLEKLENESEQLNEKISSLQKQSAKLAEKAIIEETLKVKEKALGVLMNKHRSGLLALLGRVPERGFALAVSEAESVTKADVDGMKRQLREKQNQVTKLEAQRAHARERLREKQEELTTAEDTLYRACGAQPYEATLAKLDAAVAKLRDEQNILQSSVFVINKYKSQLEQNNSCPLCNRGFDSQSEVVQLISELTTKVVNVPARLEAVSERLSREEARRDELVQLGPLSAKVAALKGDGLSQTKERLEELDRQLTAANESVEEVSMSLMEPEQRLQTVQQLSAEMPLLDRYTLEIQSSTKELQAVKEQCRLSEGSESLEAASERHAELRRKAGTLRASVKGKRADLAAHTRRVQDVTQRRNQLKEQLLGLQKKAQEVFSLQESLRQQVSARERCALELRALDDAAPRLDVELKAKENSLKALKEKNCEAIDSMREQINKLNNALEKIKALEEEVRQHEEKKVNEELKRLKEATNLLRSKKEQLISDRSDLTKKIDSLKDELSKQELYKRDLDDNRKLRAAAAEEAACEREVAQLEAAAGGVDRASVAGKSDLIRRQTDMFKERAETEGRIKELQQTVKSSKLELELPENIELEEKYRLKFYELQVIKSLDKDIKDYSSAMEKCLMQFHREKMANINLIIREMWRKIYRGNDIDYIEIKTGDTDTEKARRKYEYRVVQCKNGVEIDMRGRCSAGQRVLACLIIRLALAETFSTRFGVLALDEPTTNLDEENVKSLCRALGDIVQERARQRNFMFVVITHDREFVESLAGVDKVSHFYEVSRNDDGKSRIKKVKFT